LIMSSTLSVPRLASRIAAFLSFLLSVSGAYAQTGVSTYGTIDVCGIHSSTGSGAKRAVIDSGCHDTSVIGWRAQEAIAPGLNVFARLEYGLAVDHNSGIGAPSLGGGALSRQGHVGLSGAFGSVVVGRVSSPVKVMQVFDPVGGSSFSGLVAVLPIPLNSRSDPTHFSNAVRYISPELGGWQHFAVYAFAPYAEDDKAHASNQERAALVVTYYRGKQ
jgi:predicted porin